MIKNESTDVGSGGKSSFNWSDSEYKNFGLKAQVCQHSYHLCPLFEQIQLIELLDNFPRKWLQAFTMGEDPCQRKEWSSVDIPEQCTGEQIWQAVERGRLWLNLTHIEEFGDNYRDLIHDMYTHLGQKCPHLKGPKAHYSTLLISSPSAQVYYHLDAEPNMLWHLAGQKKLWVYPAMDTTFVPQNFLEDIYAGEIDEDLPYDPAFDQAAECYTLTPGDVASWPHNAPHRIENETLNVSLTTSYYTPTIYRRQYTQLANRFLLRNLGVETRSMAEDGPGPALKRMTYRAINKVRPFARRSRSASYITDIQIDPDAPEGTRKLSESRYASFSSEALANKRQA